MHREPIPGCAAGAPILQMRLRGRPSAGSRSGVNRSVGGHSDPEPRAGAPPPRGNVVRLAHQRQSGDTNRGRSPSTRAFGQRALGRAFGTVMPDSGDAMPEQPNPSRASGTLGSATDSRRHTRLFCQVSVVAVQPQDPGTVAPTWGPGSCVSTTRREPLCRLPHAAAAANAWPAAVLPRLTAVRNCAHGKPGPRTPASQPLCTPR